MSEIVDQIEYELKDHLETFRSIESIINPERLKRQIAAIEKDFTEKPEIFNDPARMNAMNKDLLLKKRNLDQYNELASSRETVQVAIEFCREEDDAEMIDELKAGFVNFQEQLKKANLKFLLNGEYDLNNAILTIHPGAGGTESCDWASLLHRMYLRNAENMGFKVRELDFQPGDVAGVKSVTLSIEGDYAYGYLRSEMGVHRLVRISPFDSSARRHTSFASVEVAPEVDDNVEIEIDQKDLRIDTYCSSGAGGQSVNTTYSAVRITHHPTGIVVTCQNERSQLMNRQVAMKVLQSRLLQLELKKKQEELAKSMGQKMDNAWGSQVRSYVLHPYQMVKDHRTGCETSATDKVLDGELEDFVLSFLKWDGQKGSAEEEVQ